MAESEKYTFFWRAESPFSQWHACNFIHANGVEYSSAEQYMMHQKAVLFEDEEVADAVLATDSPREQKALGRQVKNFVEAVWQAKCVEIVKDGNYVKFTQNDDLRAQLLATRGTVLVEASPMDRIWGIGLSADDTKAQRKRNWRGKNLLGYALTSVRDRIANELVDMDKTT